MTVKGAAAQLADLASAVEGLRAGISLSDKVQATQSYLATGDTTDACSTLNAFIHEVKAQTGKAITSTEASQLITDAERIQAVIGC